EAVRELQTRNLLSGLAGLGSAAMTFLALVIGGVLGGRLGVRAWGPARVPEGEDLPSLLLLVGAAALGLAAVIILRAPRRDAPTVVGRGCSPAGGGHAVASWAGSGFGAFVGPLVVGLAPPPPSRLWHKPVWLGRAPGLLVLVPGSIGFRGLFNPKDRDGATSIETG